MTRKNLSILALACALLLPLAAGASENEHVRRLRVTHREYGAGVDDMVMSYREEHPSAMITTSIDKTERGNEALQKALDNPAVSPDLIEMTSGSSDIEKNIRMGYVAEIEYLPLKEDVLSMDGRVARYLSRDGSVYGYPVDVYPNFKAARVDLLHLMGRDAAPETVEQYLRLLCRWYEKFAGQAVDFTVNGCVDAKECQMAEFLNLTEKYAVCFGEREDFSYDDPAFRSALRALHRLGRFAGREPKADAASASMMFYYATPTFFSNGETGKENIFFPLPTVFYEGDLPRLSTELTYFMIPALAQNEGDATAFIEYHKDNMWAGARTLLYPDAGEPENPDALLAYEAAERDIMARADKTDDPDALADLVEEMSAAEEAYFEDVKVYSDEEARQIDFYRAWSPYLSIENDYLALEMTAGEEVYQAAEEYFSGRMTTDEMIALLDARAAQIKSAQ